MAKGKNNRKKSAKPVSGPGGTIKNERTASNKKNTVKAKKTAPKKKASAKAADNGPSFIQKTAQFFREVKIELKKVTWPSRKETLASTSVVLVLVFLVAIFLGLVDIVLSRAMKYLLN